jgi:hypothetical protein
MGRSGAGELAGQGDRGGSWSDPFPGSMKSIGRPGLDPGWSGLDRPD